MITTRNVGTIKLMKPNFADIFFKINGQFGRRIISDGTTLYTYTAPSHYTKQDADPQGKNINVWRLIIVGGFFDVYTWVRGGIYSDPSKLTYAGVETIKGTDYQVLHHKMIGTLRKKACPFEQDVYVGSDNLIHRYTLHFKYEGMPGTEEAELTNIRTGKTMTPDEFKIAPLPGSKEATSQP